MQKAKAIALEKVYSLRFANLGSVTRPGYFNWPPTY